MLLLEMILNVLMLKVMYEMLDHIYHIQVVIYEALVGMFDVDIYLVVQ